MEFPTPKWVYQVPAQLENPGDMGGLCLIPDLLVKFARELLDLGGLGAQANDESHYDPLKAAKRPVI